MVFDRRALDEHLAEGEMVEARLVDAFAGDDGLDDGALLAKDADGQDNDSVMTTRNTRQGAPGEGNPDSALNRAARRAKRRGVKQQKSPGAKWRRGFFVGLWISLEPMRRGRLFANIPGAVALRCEQSFDLLRRGFALKPIAQLQLGFEALVVGGQAFCFDLDHLRLHLIYHQLVPEVFDALMVIEPV